MIEDNLQTGVILLDKARKVIHVNDRAREICGRIKDQPTEIRNVHDIHPLFTMDYFEMADEYDALGHDELLIPRQRLFQDAAGTFSIQSKFVRDRVDSGDSNYFMINIDEVPEAAPAAEARADAFKLSGREKEVADQVVQGLHNSEIARNLYISEVTVKKHLQSIFQKTGVDNRTALARALTSV
jgi:DNA-binding CsgD family transcriptional regulator